MPRKSGTRSNFDGSVNEKIQRLAGDGLSGVDIARVVGLTPAAVRQRIYEARKLGLWLADVKPEPLVNPNPEAAWERLRSELSAQVRREFLGTASSVDPWWRRDEA